MAQTQTEGGSKYISDAATKLSESLAGSAETDTGQINESAYSSNNT